MGYKGRLSFHDYARGPQELAECIRYPQAAPNSLRRGHFPQPENSGKRGPVLSLESDSSCSCDSPMGKIAKHLNGGTQ
ncbi:hypothetical protein Hsc_3499 [Herbaspirillum seropedicae]|nr:hypothetical protein Hsc_3499 [Herbaspirillum seropedicae]